MAVRPRKISEIKPLLTHLAQTSHYEVQFGSLPPQLTSYLDRKGIDSRFIAENAGLLCYSASLPTSSFGISTIDGNHIGIQEKFAHTRMFTEITLDFYVDHKYNMLNFLESWMEFIASGSYNNQNLSGENPSINPNSSSYFTRIQYPKFYKAESVRIIKFDRDYKNEIEYNFRGLFPLSMSAVQVSYTNSDSLKVSATFQYDRYISGKTNSFNQFISRDSNNIQPNLRDKNIGSPKSDEEIKREKDKQRRVVYRTGQSLGNESGVRGTIPNQGSVFPTVLNN